jgi:hypothetical protein
MLFRFSPDRQGSTGTGNHQSPPTRSRCSALGRTPALSLTQWADECGQLTAGALKLIQMVHEFQKERVQDLFGGHQLAR